MRKKKFNKAAASRARRPKEPLPWKYCFATILLGVFLAAGFFFAARQHFYSMEYSIENSRLRNKIDDLRSRNRRLKLEKEVALSPHEIRQAAMELGLKGMTVRNLQPLGEVPESILAAVDEEQIETARPAVAIVREGPDNRTVPVAAVVTSKPVVAAPKPPAVKTVKTVKSAPAKPVEEVKKRTEESQPTTRSRIIDESAGR